MSLSLLDPARRLSPWFIASIVFFLINLIFYAKALRGLALNIAYPIMVSGTVL